MGTAGLVKYRGFIGRDSPEAAARTHDGKGAAIGSLTGKPRPTYPIEKAGPCLVQKNLPIHHIESSNICLEH